jgi:DNA-binding LacI/PurR family transcriptional regulator
MKAHKSPPLRSKYAKSGISISDVAAHAEVSVGTVSRVINRHPAVAVDLRRKVLISSRTLGFVPRQVQRCVAIVTGRQSTALPVGYVSVLTSLVSRVLASMRISVELIDIENLDIAYEAHIDGMIGIVFDERLAEFQHVPNLPIIAINKPMVDRGIHSIYADHYQQAVLATQHLIDHGHRKIAFLAIQPDEWGSQQRLKGYCDVLEKHGLQPEPSWIQYTLNTPVYEILARWRDRQISGILNFSEDTSLEVLHILSNVLGLKISSDISTVTLEDLPVYQYFTPPQTVVRQPLEDLARLAVENLIALGEQPDGGTSCLDICLPTELVARDSVATILSDS